MTDEFKVLIEILNNMHEDIRSNRVSIEKIVGLFIQKDKDVRDVVDKVVNVKGKFGKKEPVDYTTAEDNFIGDMLVKAEKYSGNIHVTVKQMAWIERINKKRDDLKDIEFVLREAK